MGIWDHFGPDDQCGYCAYMDISIMKDGRYRCEKGESFPQDDKLAREGWRFADDPIAKNCINSADIFWKDLDKRRKAVESSVDYKSKHGCHIVTAVAKILGFNDELHELQVLRIFRTEVAEENIDFYEDLKRYDIEGKNIADKLLNDANRVSIAEDLYTNYIKPCSILIESLEDYKMDNPDLMCALNKYREMYEKLRTHYSITPFELQQKTNNKQLNLKPLA